MTYCIIPARGGSEGIPKKNIIDLLGYPLLAWSIVPAQEAGLDVIVSTDDDEIAKIATEWGAAAFHRKETAGDGPSETVLEEIVDALNIDKPFVFMQCTSPFTTVQDLRGALWLYHEEWCESMFSGYALYPYLWTNDLAPMYDPKTRRRRQDKRPVWVENGAFYITRPDILKKGARVGERVSVWPMDTMLEIDEPKDLELAEWMLRERPQFAPKVLSMAERYSSLGTAARRRRPTTLRGSYSGMLYHVFH